MPVLFLGLEAPVMLAQINLNWLDLTAIVAYGVALFVMGLWFARQQQTSHDSVDLKMPIMYSLVSLSHSCLRF